MVNLDSSTAVGADAGRHWVAAFDGARLAARRQAKGWSQARLAEALHELNAETAPGAAQDALDVARRLRTIVVQVSTYESGRTRPRAKVVRDLAKVLEVDVLELLAVGAPLTLAALRARVGLAQADVAEALGMSRSLYAHVEQGRRALSHDETAALASVLRVDGATLVRALPQ